MSGSSARGGFTALDPCVHCGFCLSACPTYLATGDENASPRGRIVLMRALERGELAPADPALAEHLGSCLGCRGCEPACPSGVGYGAGLEEARVRIAAASGLGLPVRAILAWFARPWRWRALFALGRWLRETGIPDVLGRMGGPGFAAGMLAATRPLRDGATPGGPRQPALGESVALFRGCVMEGLFGHVHDATARTLRANGYRVVEVAGQQCCGALHDHAGDRDGARALAAANLAAFQAAPTDWIAVNSAGCGALLRTYHHLLGDAAADLAGRVRDVSELLAARGPRAGAALPLDVLYDAPCHLQHAQRVHDEPLAVLRAVPGLRLQVLPSSDRCCGSAGLYGVLHPGLSRAVLAAKLESFVAAGATGVVATGNPGCLMQIGSGLLEAGIDLRVAHPVELLDLSYERAGLYAA